MPKNRLAEVVQVKPAMSDDEMDEDLPQNIADKSTSKKSILNFGRSTPKPAPPEKQEKKPDQSESKHSEGHQTTMVHASTLLTGSYNQMSFTGSATLMHLNRIPDKLMIDDKPSKRERSEINLIKRMIISYFDVVKKNVNDLVPKTIITFFIRKTIDMAEKEMVHNLYDESMIESIMREDQDVVTQRTAVQANLAVLKECLVLMSEFEHSR